MSFPKYPEYKDSEVPWLGHIPSGWTLLPFFSRFSERKESNKGMKSTNLLSLSYGRIINKDINTLDGLLPASFETYQVVHEGDIIFRLTDLQNDKRSLRSAMAVEQGIITSAYLAVYAREISADFASYLFRAYDLMKVFYSMGGGLRQSMKFDDMKWLPIVTPGLQEQTQIARFLDHETAKIDALIREQEHLIELLQEKRQAVVFHAVTKGLDPDVPMKDSGVEWLGAVPAHWEVMSVRRVSTKVATGGTPTVESPSTEIDGGVNWFTPGDFCGTLILSDSAKKVSKAAAEMGDVKLFPGGSVVVVGIGATLGKVALIQDTFSANQQINVITPSPRVCGHYLAYSLVAQTEQMRVGSNASTIGIMNQEKTKDVIIAIPPEEDQSAIMAWIDATNGQIDALLEQARSAIHFLTERRSALISAAVTGKIDVREWQPPADESAFDEEVRQAGLETTA